MELCKTRNHHICVVVLCVSLCSSFLGCDIDGVHRRQGPNEAERVLNSIILEKGEDDPHRAYQRNLEAKNQLERLARERPDDLNYPYVLARVYGRLFLLASQLGYAEDAESFYQQSALYFSEVRKSLRLPPTNYSKAAIAAKMEVWENAPVLTNKINEQ